MRRARPAGGRRMRGGRVVAALLLAAAPLLAAACGEPSGDEPPSVHGLPPASLGLSPGPLDEAPPPLAWTANDTMPGEQPPLPPAYQGAPPVIPHGIDAFLPLTSEENNCLLCHQPGGQKVEGEPTPLPASHRTDLRRAPGKLRDDVAGARHNCLACHVPRTDAPPLVDNRFASPPDPAPGS